MRFLERCKADLICLKGGLRTLRATTPIAKNPTRIFPLVMEELAERYGDAPALLSDRERLSYRELASRANRYARWALAQDLAPGETICLLMPNRPEYMAVWLGITRVGGVVSLLNTNLTGASLAHSINAVAPKHVIVAAELAGIFATAQPYLKGSARIWSHGPSADDRPRIDQQIDALPGDRLAPDERRAVTIEDRALYVYTSGTTGLPKAANINHYRVMLASFGFAGVMDTRADDRMYDCLPMYHTSGGVAATGSLLVRGGSVVIREKFSARDFWHDVTRWDCTLFQYIGELCRYLANTPPHPGETRHRIRLACGNGLRPDIWEQFRDRFRIPAIIEFYGATEGNVLMFNFEGKPGAVGRIPWFFAHRFPVDIIKYDVARQAPVRDPNGFCIPCAADEPGEAIGKIVKHSARPGNRFDGYASAEETDKKILRDVRQKGDAWFRSGDLMRRDADGYFQFVDRIGDTFRWKGENVASAEVAETIMAFPGVREATVYGVVVAGREGRAGMAALVMDGRLDLKELHRHLVNALPDYARPVFLRIRDELEVTPTFKLMKLDLAREGFDPSLIPDLIYFADPQARAFVRLDQALYERIQKAQVRL